MEFIGDLIALALLCCLATGTAASSAFIAWLLTRNRGAEHRKFVFLGASLPPASLAAYIITFEIAFALLVPAAHESFPGDIDEPLPEGYTLKGIDKMPDYSFITWQEGIAPRTQAQVPSNIASVAVEGPLVFGSFRTRQSWDTLPLPSGFFVFNTATSTTTLFSTKAELDAFAGHVVPLLETSRFSSREPTVRYLRRLGGLIQISVPILALIFLLMKIFAYRASNKPSLQPPTLTPRTLTAR